MRLHKRMLLLLIPVVLIGAFAAASSWREQIRLRAATPLEARLAFYRPDWTPTAQVTDRAKLQLLGSAFLQASHLPAIWPNDEVPLYRFQLTYPDRAAGYLLTHDLRIFTQEKTEELLPNSQAQQELLRLRADLKRQQFGELLPWSEVSLLVPRQSVFSLTDLETGLSWRAQRRAGSQHADIQPLTKADTAVMKTAFGGAWSWNRRAVVVESAGRRIAASINGMPHGGGALVNNFPGHHCLHFLGSTTHGGDNLDPLHQLMVHRAAGELCEYLDQQDPANLQVLALELAGQGDVTTLSLLLNNATQPAIDWVARIRDLRIWSKRLDTATAGRLTGHYNLSVYFAQDQSEHRLQLTLTCRYHGQLGKWLVEPDYLPQIARYLPSKRN